MKLLTSFILLKLYTTYNIHTNAESTLNNQSGKTLTLNVCFAKFCVICMCYVFVILFTYVIVMSIVFELVFNLSAVTFFDVVKWK